MAELLKIINLRTLSPFEQVQYLEDAALASFDFLASYQQTNGLIPASLGRSELIISYAANMGAIEVFQLAA